ncbi:tyrosine-protein kinase transmembrane receptor Ror [Ptiloglossa arizonensis]|uniref:tyrosine-protein kinase transmembrane receptor Ror n=1 Tax=Ptiloglossa arizonensis TaxID=3350558 RepID=UPI003F9F5244
MEAVSGAKSGTLKFIHTLTNISKDAGGVAHMRCEVVGDPPPTKIKWYKNEAPLEERRPKITIKKIHAQAHEHAAKNIAGCRLKITNLDVSDVGFYTCRVTNGKDQIQSEGTLRVDSSKSRHAPIQPDHSIDQQTDDDRFSPDMGGDSDFIDGIRPGDGLDLSGPGMSTPHISHLASTNPFSILSPSPQPTSSQSSTTDVHTIGGLRNVNMQLSPGRKDNHEGKCEVYVGKTCEQFLENQSVYIPYPMTQELLDEKLMKAFGVIEFSNEVSFNCEGYAKPSLCYSAFPICRDPASILKLKNSKSLFHLLNNNQGGLSKDIGDGDDADDIQWSHGIPKKRSPTLGPGSEFNPYKDGKSSNKKLFGQSYGDVQSSSRNEINRKLRRICREECEILENELCRKEYAIAKRHPMIGHQVPLINCSDLPMENTPEARDCLSLGISTENSVQETPIQPDHSIDQQTDDDRFSPDMGGDSDFIDGIRPGDGLDLSGPGMSTPHISHLASTNPFSILSPSPQPTSSQSSTTDVHTIGGLRNVNMQLSPGRKDNHEGKCEVYVGKTCEQFLENQSVYIPYPMTQELLDEKLMKAFGVIEFSNEVSFNCEGYAKASLCYSAFSICRDPASILKLKNSKSLFHLLNNNQGGLSKDIGDGDDADDIQRSHGIPKKRSPTLGPGSEFNPYKDGKSSNKKLFGQSYGDVQSSSRNEINRKLRRICREECEILENELCRKEYAIAKRHPMIGHQVPLINCSDLPMENTPEARDCLSLGISTENSVQETPIQPDHSIDQQTDDDRFSPDMGGDSDFIDGIRPGDGLDLSGPGMSTPHISHLASTNPFSILSPSPQPTSSQSSTTDVHTIGGLRNVNMQLSPGRKDNHEGKCEVYVGKTCEQFLENQSVYIPYPMTQELLDEKLMKAFGVIEFSNEVSFNCEGYAKASLCYSAFSICRDPASILKLKNSKSLFHLLNNNQGGLSKDIGDGDDADDIQRSHGIPKKRSPTLGPGSEFNPYKDGKSSNKKLFGQSYGDVQSSSRNEINRKLRRICREECEILENELCRKEYAIAKRHPMIGHQVPLINCSDLPMENTPEARDCLSLGISTENSVQETPIQPDHSIDQQTDDDRFSPDMGGDSDFIDGIRPGDGLDLSGPGMSTPHISHLASTNPFSILSPSPQPTSSQSSTTDVHTIGGLRNVNMQLSPGRKDNHEGKCEVYVGKTCEQFLENQSVYIPYPMTQELLDEKLMKAFGVIEFSNEVSFNCEGYAKASLCYSAFSICRDPASILKLKNSKSLFHLLNNNQGGLSKDIGDGDDADDIQRSHGIPKKRSPTLGPGSEFNPYKDGKSSNKKLFGQSYGDVQSSSRNEINRKLRRICREECEILENELCRKEYAIAKRHPMIGHQVPLINCSDLPMENTPEARDCLSLGISTENSVQERIRVMFYRLKRMVPTGVLFPKSM